MENRLLSTVGATQLQEGINLLLSQWSALQVAVENEFGGRDSRQKSQQLPPHLFSWFTQSRGPLYIDELENILDEFMLSLNTEIDDGSIEEVAEKLMIMHEECLEGNFTSVEKLRGAPRVAVQHIIQDASGDGDEDDDLSSREDDGAEMAVDTPESQINMGQKDMMVDKPNPSKEAQAEDGWTVVSSKRGKNRRN